MSAGPTDGKFNVTRTEPTVLKTAGDVQDKVKSKIGKYQESLNKDKGFIKRDDRPLHPSMKPVSIEKNVYKFKQSEKYYSKRDKANKAFSVTSSVRLGINKNEGLPKKDNDQRLARKPQEMDFEEVQKLHVEDKVDSFESRKENINANLHKKIEPDLGVDEKKQSQKSSKNLDLEIKKSVLHQDDEIKDELADIGEVEEVVENDEPEDVFALLAKQQAEAREQIEAARAAKALRDYVPRSRFAFISDFRKGVSRRIDNFLFGNIQGKSADSKAYINSEVTRLGQADVLFTNGRSMFQLRNLFEKTRNATMVEALDFIVSVQGLPRNPGSGAGYDVLIGGAKPDINQLKDSFIDDINITSDCMLAITNAMTEDDLLDALNDASKELKKLVIDNMRNLVSSDAKHNNFKEKAEFIRARKKERSGFLGAMNSFSNVFKAKSKVNRANV